MFLLTSVSTIAAPLAATADEIQPWMIAAIAAGALLALLLIIVAARKSRKSNKGDDLRAAMSAGREDIQNTGEIWKDFEPINPENADEATPPVVPATPASTQAKATGSKGKSKGKHAK
ncbi:MAG: hypothetical protein IJ113_07835 [Eggerthellaceae bacterium]|nr:hypothetical protein [Eggerthellaceae bacterium]